MTRSLLVARREFLENVRTKGFWFGILMMPVMLILLAMVPLLVESTRAPKTYVVIDQSGWLFDAVEREIEFFDLVLILKSQGIAELTEQTAKGFKNIKDITADLSEKEIRDLAGGIIHKSQSVNENLPLALRNQLQRQGPEIRQWWLSLDAKTKARMAPGVSSNNFLNLQKPKASLAELNEMVQRKELFAYFIIGPYPTKDSEGFRYVSNNLTDRDLLNWFSIFVNTEIQKNRLQQENIDPAVSSWINTPADFEAVQISGDGNEEEVQATDVVRQWAPVFFVYLLWVSILISTQMLLTNTIEEKSNKLIEVLLSSISPVTLMSGKIMGIASTGLTIIGAWVLMVSLVLLLIPGAGTPQDGLAGASGIQLPFDLASIAQDPLFLGSFLVYFILGYLFYAAVLVGLGSICNNLKEAQNLTLPVQMFQLIPIVTMVPIGRDPNGTMAQVLSYFPPFTPFVMMNRAAAPPTNFEYITTTILMVFSITVALWFAAKIFRVGILLSGKPPTIREVWRWLRTPT